MLCSYSRSRQIFIFLALLVFLYVFMLKFGPSVKFFMDGIDPITDNNHDIHDDVFVHAKEDKLHKNLNVKKATISPTTTEPPGTCRERRFNPKNCSEEDCPMTLLASYPGSGNTWFRHLLEEATGIYTGSVWNDTTLKKGLKGEGYTDRRVVAVKTHHPFGGEGPPKLKPSKVIVLVRNLSSVLITERHRKYMKGKTRENWHLRLADQSAFEGPDWLKHVNETIQLYINFHRFWFKTYATESKGGGIKIHLVRYENLLDDVKGELTSVLNYLDQPVHNWRLKCVTENTEGRYHRKQNVTSDIFSEDVREHVQLVSTQFEKMITQWELNS